MDESYITIPVFASFNLSNPVGELRLLKSALPLTPDFHFALAYTVLSTEKGVGVTEYKPVAVAINSNAHFVPSYRK